MTSPVAAQGGLTPSQDIFFGQPVTDSINDEQFFDWWRFYGGMGNIYFIRMEATNGLAPLIGVLGAGGDLLAESERGEINGEVMLRFTAPSDGFYTIVATRVGTETGTTTGDYGLRIDWLNPPPTRDPLYQDVTFDCDGQIVTSVLKISFFPDLNSVLFLRVYGLDGLRPVIRYRYDSTGESGCSTTRAIGDVMTLPGEIPVTISESNADTSAALNLPIGDGRHIVELTVGALDDGAGRYVVLLGGLMIAQSPTPAPNTPPRLPDSDLIEVRLAPRAGTSPNPTSVYMVGEITARLDPFMRLLNAETGCDDAGRRTSVQSSGGCESMPSFVGGNISPANGTRYIGDRFDAGIQIEAGNTLPVTFEFTTFNRSTYGHYGMIVIGDVPAR